MTAPKTLLIAITKKAARAFVRNHFAYGVGRAPSLSISEMEAVTGQTIELRQLGNGCGQYLVTPTHYAAQTEMQTRARKLEARFNRFSRYMREGRHAWEATGETRYWGDNAQDVEERSRLTGETRWRQTVPPHGDVCF